MIVHIFPCLHPYHSLGMIENIIKHSRYDCFFLLKGNHTSDIENYKKMFDKYNVVKYKFILNNKHLIFSFIYWFKILFFAYRYRKNTFLFHSLPSPYLIFVLSIYVKNINGVCWSLRFIDKNMKIPPFKRKIFHIYKNINCLVPQEEKELEIYYGYKRTRTIPYINDLSITLSLNKKTDFSEMKYCKILLGNSAWKVDYYIQIIKDLKELHFNKKIKVLCMMNYGSVGAEKKQLLECLGEKYWGNRFALLTDFMPMEKYNEMFANTDIYICSWETQTGLAAVYISLLLGVKMFLSGANYKLVKSLGCIVFHTDDIKNMSNEEFLKPLTELEKVNNSTIIREWLDTKRLITEWNKFYSEIL